MDLISIQSLIAIIFTIEYAFFYFREDKLKDAETDAQTNANYHELNEKANIIYEFVMKYNDYIKTSRDYGTDEI